MNVWHWAIPTISGVLLYAFKASIIAFFTNPITLIFILMILWLLGGLFGVNA